ncbi:MAG: TauD/TfdA family dioxygenase [Burkholderiaceae bacterium]|nr:TauD/TfdA family dioxygenase [Sulfuritalea sp.]MCF8176013.1 TauD/TfdA family dioxygenase [Burkholderiaceae bacterium]
MMPGPFDLNDVASYRRWREAKLDSAPRRIEDIVVALDDPRALSVAERDSLLRYCASANMAIYTSNTVGDADKEIPRRLGAQLGLLHLDSHWLTDDDAISPISVRGAEERGERKEFIPYTDKPIKWHTDGYYNVPERTVRGMVLHCVQRAESGGENQLLDHEIAYILLRDANPEHVRALSLADTMTIPPRNDDNGVARDAQSGPVFSVDGEGFLHMRYTARSISIDWRADAATAAAVAALAGILAAPTPWTLHGRLEPGMGLVCNNVLHDRSGFTDGAERHRLLYRARYHERITSGP